MIAATCLTSISAYAADGVSPEVEEGRELYDSFGCYQCHGSHGQGGNAGPGIAPGPLPYEAFRVFVRTPAAKMPPYAERVLSDEQLRQMHIYLESLERGPAASEIPLLDLSIQPGGLEAPQPLRQPRLDERPQRNAE